MRKLVRDPEQFDVLELFSNLGASLGYDVRDPASADDFIKRVRRSLELSKKKSTVIHGQRTEALFAYVVGALGKVILLNQEDAGDVFFAGENILVPDYRLTFQNGSQLMVEVKNCHHRNPEANITITKDYFNKLYRYAEINQIDLKFAVLYSRWNKWCLLGINAFEEHEDCYKINMLDALKSNEMTMLGDLMVGAAPNLEIHVLADPIDDSEIDENGLAHFVIKEVKLFCMEKEIVNEHEKKLALFIMQHGDWQESEPEAFVVNNKFYGVRFIYSPEQQQEPNFAIIGNLSSMVTNAYKDHTVENGEVKALKVGFDPAVFEVIIPDDYVGERLPLWRFQMCPTSDV